MSEPAGYNPLVLGTEWSIGEEGFKAIVDDLSEIKPDCIVEFGSGTSSIRLAQAFPHTEILSIEHDPKFFQETKALKARFAPVSKLTLSLRPLQWQRVGLAWYLSYSRKNFPDCIDAVIIDGPPYYILRGREACLHQVIRYIRTGGRIYLDDYYRLSEKQIIENWLCTYPGVFEKKVLDVGHKICVIKKLKIEKRVISWKTLRNNYQVLYQLGKNRIKQLIKRSYKYLK